MKPSDILKPYDNVLTIRTSIGNVAVYKIIEKFLKIEDKNGDEIPFILNDDQVDLYKTMCEQALRKEPIRINILKARQKGFSTFIAGVIFVCTIFQPGKKAAIVADVSDHARELFHKYQFFFDKLPKEMQLDKIASNARELVVRHKNGSRSSIRVLVQGEASGRGSTYQYLHLSECAFWDDLQKTLTSLLQTVSNTNVNSMVFLETTANGVNDYKVRWDNDVTGNTRYIAKFYAWFTTKDYRNKYLRDYDKPTWLLDYQQKYSLDEEQALWFYDEWQELQQDLDFLRQEYPSNPVEAFITTGNSVFNVELLLERKAEILKEKPLKRGEFVYEKKTSLDGGQITLSNIRWLESRNGSIKIYEEPNPTRPYVVSNDPAMGGEDYFSTQVFDNYSCKQVAVYHKNRCDADDCAFQMYCLAKYYNDAMITGETNTTSYLLQVCYKCGHRFIYQDQDVEDLGTRYANKFGYKTKQNNRQYMITLFAQAFRDDPKIIRDYETICEMENFQYVKSASKTKNGAPVEKAMATGGFHDDLVTSIMGFFLCRNEQRAIPLNNPVKREETIYEIEKKIEERRRDLSKKRKVYSIWD